MRFVAKHFPLEGECNPNAPNGNHMAACEAAAAVVLARETGKAAAMEDWLYDHQTTLTPSMVREAAKDVGGIADFNGGYAKALEEVKADARMGGVARRQFDADVLPQRAQASSGCRSARSTSTHSSRCELQRAK